jgi:SNF2 family DNA or RNA helicase
LNIAFYKVRFIVDTLIELNDPEALDADGKLKLSRFQSNQLSLLESGHPNINWTGGDKIREFGDKLQNFEGISEAIVPANLKAELRHYQLDGLSWLQFLREYKLGGILADDMGLGKTVQTLAHLLIEKNEKRANLPSLVIAPTSLMVNWKREAARFAPDLKVLVLHGPGRKKLFNQIKNHDLILTTYPLLTRDADVLLNQQWHLSILDEAQHIKNPKSKAAQTACLLQTRFRICLTGTPMENHLGELWSQFHFLMPDMLSDEKSFQKLYRTPIEKKQDQARQLQLRNRLAPFMLRRDKSEVATELPPKVEILSEVELEGAQHDLYEKIRVSMHDKVKQSVDNKGLSRSHIVILDALLKLRQVCCHPQLIKNTDYKLPKHSAKLNQLMEMLPEMVEEGRRILLFSQFTSMLAIIEDELNKHKIEFVKLTGQTRNREKPVDAFQSGKVPVFLISLKAGGSGLNLTAADTVIHYDPWWNPAAERQATDRAHRIGQDKHVFVYKMITSGTVEEKIIEMQNKKQALAESLFSEGQKATAITNEDLRSLFEPLSKEQ